MDQKQPSLTIHVRTRSPPYGEERRGGGDGREKGDVAIVNFQVKQKVSQNKSPRIDSSRTTITTTTAMNKVYNLSNSSKQN